MIEIVEKIMSAAYLVIQHQIQIRRVVNQAIIKKYMNAGNAAPNSATTNPNQNFSSPDEKHLNRSEVWWTSRLTSIP